MTKNLIDAGNTFIKSAVIKNAKAATGKKLQTAIAGEKSLSGLLKNTDTCVCCSVVPRVSAMLKKICRKKNIRIHFVSHRNIKGIKLKYNIPAAIGADRIATMLGALAECPPPFIIVDMGSAVSCELVDKKGNYRGGAIFPGIELSLNALYEGCALLPKTEFSRPRKGPGQNTADCIRKGVWAAAIGGIEKTVSAFLAIEPSAPVFLTGSGSGFVRPGDFSFRCKRKPALVFDGLLQFYKKIV